MLFKVRNIGGCASAKFEIKPGKLMVLAGPNRTGKTSILRALGILCTRKTDPFKDTAINSKMLATNGDTTDSEARISGAGWTLAWTPGGSVSEQGNPPETLADPVVVKPELIDKKGAQARADWSKILPCNVPHDMLRVRLLQALDDVPKRDLIVRDLCAQVFETLEPEAEDEFGHIYPGVYRERSGGWQAAKEDAAARLRAEKSLWERAVATTGVSLAWSEPRAKSWYPLGWDSGCDEMTIPEAERKAAAASEHYHKVYVENAVTESHVQMRESLKVSLQKAMRVMGERMARLEQARVNLSEKTGWADGVRLKRDLERTDALNSHAKVIRKIQRLQFVHDERRRLEGNISAEEDRLRSRRLYLSDLEGSEIPTVPKNTGTPCPHCGTRLDIRDEGVLTVNGTAALKSRYEVHMSKIRNAEGAVKSSSSRLAGLREAMERHVDEHGVDIEPIPAEPDIPPALDMSDVEFIMVPLTREVRMAENVLSESRGTVNGIEQQIEALPEGQAGNQELVRSAESEMAAARERLHMVRAWQTARGHYEAAKRWSNCVRTLQPSGLRSEHAKSVVGEFNEYLESVSSHERIVGKLHLDVETFRMMCDTRPVAHSSRSEQLVARALVSVAIAKWLKSSLVIVDDADALVDIHERRLFLDMLREQAKSENLAIVAAVADTTMGACSWEPAR